MADSNNEVPKEAVRKWNPNYEKECDAMLEKWRLRR
jgi:hypothetical protein